MTSENKNVAYLLEELRRKSRKIKRLKQEGKAQQEHYDRLISEYSSLCARVESSLRMLRELRDSHEADSDMPCGHSHSEYACEEYQELDAIIDLFEGT